MAQILNDEEIKKLFGTVILDAEVLREVLKKEAKYLRNDTLITLAAFLSLVGGMGLALYSSSKAVQFINEYAGAIGLAMTAAAVIVFTFVNRKSN